MTRTPIDLATWPRAAVYGLFRGFDRPHYAITTRLDVTRVVARKAEAKPYHACLHALGAGLHAVPAMRQRFVGDAVFEHDAIAMSVTVPDGQGAFVYADLPWQADFARFSADVTARTQAALARADLGANDGAARTDVAYLSCLPWMDFTALDNALPGPEDCIPRLSWGRFVDHGGRHDMALAVQVHHALVDGAHVGAFVAAVQKALDGG